MKTDTIVNITESNVTIYPNPNKGEFKAIITGYNGKIFQTNLQVFITYKLQ